MFHPDAETRYVWTADYDIACDFAHNESSTEKTKKIILDAGLSDNENYFLSCQKWVLQIVIF